MLKNLFKSNKLTETPTTIVNSMSKELEESIDNHVFMHAIFKN